MHPAANPREGSAWPSLRSRRHFLGQLQVSWARLGGVGRLASCPGERVVRKARPIESGLPARPASPESGWGLSARRLRRLSRRPVFGRGARRPWVTAAELLGFHPLLRGQHGVELAPGAAYDGVQLRLYLAPDRSELAPPSLHDGIDPCLLVGGESDLMGKTPPELPVPG